MEVVEHAREPGHYDDLEMGKTEAWVPGSRTQGTGAVELWSDGFATGELPSNLMSVCEGRGCTGHLAGRLNGLHLGQSALE